METLGRRAPACRAIGGLTAGTFLVCFALGTSVLCGAFGIPHADAQQPSPPATVSANGISLQSVSVELPSGDRMYAGGKDAEAINGNCLGCHSAGMVMTQPPLTRAAWQQEVDKMRTQYKAPIEPSDDPAIVAYLVSHHGAK